MTCRRCGGPVPELTALGIAVPLPYCAACGTELARAELVRETILARRRALARAGMTSRLQNQTLATHPNQPAAETARLWLLSVGSGDEANLWISGPVGTGKTGLAWGIVRELTLAEVEAFFSLPDDERDGEIPEPALFLRWADLVADLKASFDVERRGDVADPSALLARAAGVPVLVLDDLGRERPTAYAVEKLGNLVEERYNREATTIVTSNYGTRELAERLGSETSLLDGTRIVSRLLEGARGLTLAGESLRRRAHT